MYIKCLNAHIKTFMRYLKENIIIKIMSKYVYEIKCYTRIHTHI